MTSDLVSDLRNNSVNDARAMALMEAAADEIERLRGNPYCPHGLTENACRDSACDRPKPRLVESVTSKTVDKGELWSFLRAVLSQGRDIWLDHLRRDYEVYSARLDAAASERVDGLLAKLRPDETTAFRGLKSISYRPDLPLVDLVMTFDSMEAAQAARERVTALVMPPVEPEARTGAICPDGLGECDRGCNAICARALERDAEKASEHPLVGKTLKAATPAWDCACGDPTCAYCGPRLAQNGEPGQ